MKTGLKKSQKTTIIEFDEQGPRITVSTHNTDLKNRLGAYARRLRPPLAGALSGGGRRRLGLQDL